MPNRKTMLATLLAALSLALLTMACAMSAPREDSPEQAASPAAAAAPLEPEAPESSAKQISAPAGDPARELMSAPSISPAQEEPYRAILVTGQGEASAAPDLATLSLGVEASGPTVREARGVAAAAIQDMMDLLKQRSVAEEDIQTTRLNIYPKYGTRTVTRCPGQEDEPASSIMPRQEISIGVMPSKDPPKTEECITERQSVITGYEVNHQVIVKLRELDTVGEIIDEVTDAGGDLARFEGISFSLEDPEPLQEEALNQAISDARSKAQQMAGQGGVSLGDLIRLSESSSPPASPYLGLDRQFALESAAAKAVPTTVSGGSVTVHATVSAVFDIE